MVGDATASAVASSPPWASAARAHAHAALLRKLRCCVAKTAIVMPLGLRDAREQGRRGGQSKFDGGLCRTPCGLR